MGVARKGETSKENFRRGKSPMSGFRKCEYSQVFAGNDEYPPLVQKPSAELKSGKMGETGAKSCPIPVRSRWAGSLE